MNIRHYKQTEEDSKTELTCCEKMHCFFKSPCVWNFYRNLLYLIFLGFLAYNILFNFYAEMIEWNEIVAVIWVISIGIEEIRLIFPKIKVFFVIN